MAYSGHKTAIFSTDYGFIALNGPVKLQILEYLKTGPKSFDELVRCTGKAKSTISVHLNDLNSCNLVEEEIDPNDRRKKIYSLKSHYMACSQEPIVKHYQNILQKVASPPEDEYDFLKSVFQAIRFGFEAHGINHGPIMKKIGSDIGKSISGNFLASDPKSLIREMGEFWKIHKMGTLSLVDTDPLMVVVYDCFDCKSLPSVGKTLCTFEEGLLEGILFEKLGLRYTVKEIECYGTGHTHCLFLIE